MSSDAAATIDLDGLGSLLGELVDRGYDVYGPRVTNGVIALDLLRSVDDLPLGWTDEQAGGHYRLVPRDDDARFGYAVGPESWKSLLHPARAKVWSMDRSDGEAVRVTMQRPQAVRRAFVGVRPCEVAAIAKQDRVLLGGPHPDPAYRANREDLCIVAVNCGDPAATCFCTSMGTGPEALTGFDLVLTELVDGHDVCYVAQASTDLGHDLLGSIPSRPTTGGDRSAARAVIAGAVERISRRLDTNGIKELLYEQLDSPHWDDIAARCLTCGNCTMACPTCFCTDLEDVTDLSGDHAERWRVWDTCFSLEFSHLGPGPLRASATSRYRQWMTHKLATWIDQFDESGCVGCGRCITWCPVGIDITSEASTFREAAGP